MAAERIFALSVAIALGSGGCASEPKPVPWTASEYRIAKEDFDRTWDAAVVTIAKWFEGLDHANKPERRIESAYYYVGDGLKRQRADLRIDPDGEEFVVRIRTVQEELLQDFPPRWVIVGTDPKANRLLLDEIRSRAFPSNQPSPRQGVDPRNGAGSSGG
jgi:hypothetical protein